MDFDKFYNKALKFLSYRPRSKKEIRDYLVKKIKNQKSKIKDEDAELRIKTETIEKIIGKLEEYKFLDDEEFARIWIQSRIKAKPRAWRVIKFELKQKGISDEIIESLIQDLGFIIQDLEMAKDLVRRRIERYKGLPKQEVYQKLGRFLASKGFNWDTIKKAIDEISNF
jgi:regulatory protein